jgi:CHAD domain-containing protein
MSIAPERSLMALQKTERALAKVASAQDPESVHCFRTSSRRLQTLLEQVLPERDRNQKKLLKMLERIRGRAGKVRDLDVQLAALRSLKIPQEPRRKTQLMHRLIELRAKHEKKLRKLLDRETIQEIRKRLKRTSKELNLQGSKDALTVARAILQQVEHTEGPFTEEVLHQYRTVVKRARYAAEFGPRTAEAMEFTANLKRLQDAVGIWHDWLTLTHTATKRLGGVNQSSLVAVLHNVTGGKFRQAVAVLSASSILQTRHQPVPTPEQARKSSSKGPTLLARNETAA